MMKDQIIYRKYDSTKDDVNTLVCLHQSIFLESQFENNLIYFDPNFKNFFFKITVSKGNFIYVIEYLGEIIGFVHFKKIDDFIFLNNIAINVAQKSKGLGKRLLRFALIDISNNFHKEIKIKLDVFQTNENAFFWYLKLGFIKESDTAWFRLVNHKNRNHFQNNFSIKLDENSFRGVFNNDTRLATIINNNLLIHNYQIMKNSDLAIYDNVLINDSNLRISNGTSESTKNLIKIDVSLRLVNELYKVLENI